MNRQDAKDAKIKTEGREMVVNQMRSFGKVSDGWEITDSPTKN
jgi:hypothetical protein